MINKIKGALFGLSVGDALGVPVEFKSREDLKVFPVTKMKGYGSWSQPAGTWSDDSSLAFCLAESLTNGYDLNDIAQNFIKWKRSGYWGAHHKVFDIGNTSFAAISRLERGITPVLAGGMEEADNGNGSLMRIMPLLFTIKDLPVEERYEKIKEVSSLTHAHFRSVFACFIYLEFALQLLQDNTIAIAYNNMQHLVKTFADANDFNLTETALFARILDADIRNVKEDKIYSGGYVLHTLEASLWCLLNTDNYTDAVLKAVNLGGDTDTTACVTGGLAGLLYGYDEILTVWTDAIARKNDIEDLCERLYKKLRS
ncbi:ADP-ribosylglycohydrolase family protein [Ferruginibacter sp.]